jgi:hypothetical protein
MTEHPMLLDCSLERALTLYETWRGDQVQLGLSDQVSLWASPDGAGGLCWRVRVEPELAARAFELSGF